MSHTGQTHRGSGERTLPFFPVLKIYRRSPGQRDTLLGSHRCQTLQGDPRPPGSWLWVQILLPSDPLAKLDTLLQETVRVKGRRKGGSGGGISQPLPRRQILFRIWASELEFEEWNLNHYHTGMHRRTPIPWIDLGSPVEECGKGPNRSGTLRGPGNSQSQTCTSWKSHQTVPRPVNQPFNLRRVL